MQADPAKGGIYYAFLIYEFRGPDPKKTRFTPLNKNYLQKELPDLNDISVTAIFPDWQPGFWLVFSELGIDGYLGLGQRERARERGRRETER